MTDSSLPQGLRLEVLHLFAHVLAERDLIVDDQSISVRVSEEMHCNNLGILFGGVSLFSAFASGGKLAEQHGHTIESISMRYLRPVSPGSVLELSSQRPQNNAAIETRGMVAGDEALVASLKTRPATRPDVFHCLPELDARFNSEVFEVFQRSMHCRNSPMKQMKLPEWFWLLSAIDAAGGLLTSLIPGVELAVTAQLEIRLEHRMEVPQDFHILLDSICPRRTSIEIGLSVPGVATATATFVNVGSDMKPKVISVQA